MRTRNEILEEIFAASNEIKRLKERIDKLREELLKPTNYEYWTDPCPVPPHYGWYTERINQPEARIEPFN